VAYDLLLRKQTRRNWSLHSYRGPRVVGTFLLAEYVFAPDPERPTVKEAELLAHLAVLKLRVDQGDKRALKEWRSSMKKVLDAKKRAERGDPVAQHLVKVLNESGLFAGVQRVEV
jgi:hypothetical protein